VRQATCHPDRKHNGHGLCKRCYMKIWNKAHRRPYDRNYHKAYYQRNKEKLVKRSRARKKLVLAEIREFIVQYLLNNPCVDCGERDIIVLDFDHVRGKKSGNISRLMHTGTLSTIQDEIRKCDIRCANCHRRKTARTHKNYRLGVSCEASTKP